MTGARYSTGPLSVSGPAHLFTLHLLLSRTRISVCMRISSLLLPVSKKSPPPLPTRYRPASDGYGDGDGDYGPVSWRRQWDPFQLIRVDPNSVEY